MIHLLVLLPVFSALFLGALVVMRAKNANTILGNRVLPTAVSLFVLVFMLVIIVVYWFQAGFSGASQQLQLLSTSPDWLDESRYSWIPQMGVSWYLAIDGLSALCLTLVLWLALVSFVLLRRQQRFMQVKESTPVDKYALAPVFILAVVSCATVMMLAIDLLLVTFAWCVLICVYFSLLFYVRHSLAQHVPEKNNGQLASVPMYLFGLAQLTSMFMLAAVLVLMIAHYNQHEQLTFSYVSLLSVKLPNALSDTVMFGFAGSVILLLPLLSVFFLQRKKLELPAFVMQLSMVFLVLSVYVLWRFVLPLFPEVNALWSDSVRSFALVVMCVSAIMAFSTARVFSKSSDGKSVKRYKGLSLGFYSCVVLFHLAVAWYAIYTGDLLSWQSLLLYLVSSLLGLCGLYMLHGLLIHKLVNSNKANAHGMTRLSLLFFVCIASGFPVLSMGMAQFHLLLRTLAYHPIEAICLMVSWLLVMLAMGRYLLDALHVMGMSGDSHLQATSENNKEFVVEWSVLVVMALVVMKMSFMPQTFLDTSYESFRWIHHVYTKPREIHGGDMPLKVTNQQAKPERMHKQTSKQDEVTP